MIVSKEILLHFAGASVAQWIEHESNEIGDAGSSPVRGISPGRPHPFLGRGLSFTLFFSDTGHWFLEDLRLPN